MLCRLLRTWTRSFGGVGISGTKNSRKAWAHGCTGLRDVTAITLKTALNTMQSIKLPQQSAYLLDKIKCVYLQLYDDYFCMIYDGDALTLNTKRQNFRLVQTE